MIDVHIDLRVAELLASRLCHDLVGPIGAVNNGMELLEEEQEAGMAQDALRLASRSAHQAANALQFYRLAYGMAGVRIGGDIGEVRDLAARFLARGKVGLEWAVQVAPEATPEGLGKLMLNMIALAEETLPRGGTLTVAALAGPGGTEASVTASGSGVKLREESAPALAEAAPLEALTPRNVQGYFTKLLARRLGADLAIDSPGPERLRFSVALPAVAQRASA